MSVKKVEGHILEMILPSRMPSECHQNGFCSNTDFFLQMDLELFGNICSLLKMAESQRVFSFRKFQAQFLIAGGHRQILLYNMPRDNPISTCDGFSHSVWTTQPSARYKLGWREAVLRSKKFFLTLFEFYTQHRSIIPVSHFDLSTSCQSGVV